MKYTLSALVRLGMAAFLLAVGLGAPTQVAHATTGAVLTVNSNSDVDSDADAFCTLREALVAAYGNADYHGCVNSGAAYGDDRIQFSLVSTTITLTTYLPIMYSGTLTIDGSNGGAPVIIDGANAHRAFEISGGTLTLGNLTVQHASANMGAGAAATASTLIVLRSAFLNNAATGGDGGAINCNQGCNLTVANSTFAGNTASAAGGAVVINSGTAGIYNSTFTANGAVFGGGAVASWNGGAGNPTVTLHNSILANSSGTNDCYNYSLGTLSGSNNIIGTTADAPSACTSVTLSSSNPNLAAVTGSPAYYPLGVGSPAIDAGDNTACGNAPVNGLDQRGVSRPQGAGCDIGSYEVGYPFFDVPVSGKEWMEPWIEAFYYAGITTGCGASPLIYCPENQVTRAEMAVFLLRAKHGGGYAPPAPTHDFADVPVTGKEWMEPWIEQFYAEGITTGCGGGNYCPENNVTRAEMAVFVLRALHGGGYSPPAATHTFADVPVTGKEWMEPWIDQFAAEGITTGCGGGNYCPENNVTRAEMAVFIGRAYGLYP